MKNRITVGSMFAGIGGIDIGFEQAGFEVVWANELDAAACRTYRNNLNGDILVEGDIKKVDKSTIPHFDVLVAGFPCQPFSVAGNQKGFEHSSGDLFFQIVEVAKAVSPDVIFLENVANLINHGLGKTFITMFNALAELNYTVRYRNLPANEYGNTPQTRNRTYVVAFKDERRCDAFEFPKPIELKRGIFDIIDRTEKKKPIYYYDETDSFYPYVTSQVKRTDSIYRVYNSRIHIAKNQTCPTLAAFMGHSLRMVPIVIDEYGYRRLTIRECLDFQGFPKEFYFPKDTKIREAYKQIGNSVCVPVIRRIAEQIKIVMEGNMYLGNVKVEQIKSNFEVVEDYGEILSKKEMADLLVKYFPKSEYRNGCVYGEYNNQTYCIYFKNISYLGNPHPHFKKRIQIGDNFKTLLAENDSKGIITLLIGVYSYKDTLLFVDFNITKYAKRKAHNSSAHVYTIDLKNGMMFGIFQKADANENIVTVFTTANVHKYLKSKTEIGVDLRLDFISVLDEFFDSVPKTWNGKDCYQEMIDAEFNNALQPEWPGFYFEYRLSKFIKEKGLHRIIKYSQNKKQDDIDLDLFFPETGAYGDLKAHSNGTSGIQGNDWDTVMSVLENTSIYYVVCNHDTEKDSDYNNEVTVFWNTQLHKDNLLSYAKKMKHSVRLTSFAVLEINKYNKEYLSVFEQGVNSNGKPREPKISIAKKNIKNFVIYEKTL